MGRFDPPTNRWVSCALLCHMAAHLSYFHRLCFSRCHNVFGPRWIPPPGRGPLHFSDQSVIFFGNQMVTRPKRTIVRKGPQSFVGGFDRVCGVDPHFPPPFPPIEHGVPNTTRCNKDTSNRSPLPRAHPVFPSIIATCHHGPQNPLFFLISNLCSTQKIRTLCVNYKAFLTVPPNTFRQAISL